MKFHIHYPIDTTPPRIIEVSIATHINEAITDVLKALPDEIERHKKQGNTELARILSDFQSTLKKAFQEPTHGLS